jgi:hypothetical protein
LRDGGAEYTKRQFTKACELKGWISHSKLDSGFLEFNSAAAKLEEVYSIPKCRVSVLLLFALSGRLGDDPGNATPNP